MLVRSALASLLLAGALPAAATKIPEPVSPGALTTVAVIEARCPTFSWAGVPGARGYELAVFRVADAPGAEPILVARASVRGDARGFTPQVGQCLERGQRYAWSVAATSSAAQGGDPLDDHLDWAPAFLFEVEDAPSSDELEHAIATIQRHLERRRAHGVADDSAARSSAAPQTGYVFSPEAESPRAARARQAVSHGPALASPRTGIQRITSAAATPTLGDASLTVSQQIHLGSASDLFKDGSVFLWDDADGNTALGRSALSSVTTGQHNTALGREALQQTTGGDPLEGSYNTAVGGLALRANTTGSSNTATGFSALRSNTTGNSNTASGYGALRSNDTGNRNTASGTIALFENTIGYDNAASGYGALRNNTDGDSNTAVGTWALETSDTGSTNTAIGGSALRFNTTGSANIAVGFLAGQNNTTGDYNIFIGSNGSATDQATIRIGTPTVHDFTLIQGIRGVITGTADAVPVLIDSSGQLGTTSSSRDLKQDIQDLGSLADRLLSLRPVAFRYKQHAATDPDTPLEFGLIAEEVAEVFPELVVYDQGGKPQTVKYHLLSSLLLGELQRVRSEHEAELVRLGARLAALELRSSPPPPMAGR